jgi:hypothetical protein
MADRADARSKSLQRRLRAAIEHFEGLRREASETAAELRNRLHTVMAQSEALRRLDGARRSSRGDHRDEQTDEPRGERDR